ncbi:MAG: hypothetical protein IJT43_10365 [Stomatobaculum sp.]|nr:hypothetical protein [Stomatobaculum sp.]
MEVKFDVTPETAALIEELREDGIMDIDGMVSKLIPYGLFKDAEVDAADLYFEDVWYDFGLEEIEDEVGRSLSDAEVREVIIAKFAMYLNSEFEIDVAYCSEMNPGAAVHIECDLEPMTCRKLVASGCREIEEIPLLEVYDAYADENGEVYDEVPEGADSEDFREVTIADIFFCAGAEPEDLMDLLKVTEIPECHSYDYIVPQEENGDEEDMDEEDPEDD